MSNLEETKEFLKKHCLQKCNHNSNESCICKVAICFKEIEQAQEQEKENVLFENAIKEMLKNQSTFVMPLKDKDLYFIQNKYGNYTTQISKESYDIIQKIEREE